MALLFRLAIPIVVLSLVFSFDTGHALRAQEAVSPGDERVYLPWVGSRVCNQRVAPTVFGLQMYGRTDASTTYFPELTGSGASWVRVPVAWRSVEPANSDPADFKWSSADKALAVAQDGCLNVIATHRWAPSWAAADADGVVDPQYIDDMAEYLAAAVERYDGDGIKDAPGSPIVRHWELYNEPDTIDPSTSWGSAPEEYARMLKAVYPAMKKASPKVQVLLGGLAYDGFVDQGGSFDRRFLPSVVEAGGGDYFDIMNFHYFPVFSVGWAAAGPGLLEKTRAVRNELQRLGLDKPIMITESGHFVNGRPGFASSPEIQMRYLVQLYTQAKAADVDVLIWFTLHDLQNYDDLMGLVTGIDTRRKRPAYFAYQFAAQELGAADFVRKLADTRTGTASMEAYQFRDRQRNRTIYVAWLNPVSTNAQWQLSLNGTEANVRDVFGDSVLVMDGDDGVTDGDVTVAVGGRPIYIEMK